MAKNKMVKIVDMEVKPMTRDDIVVILCGIVRYDYERRNIYGLDADGVETDYQIMEDFYWSSAQIDGIFMSLEDMRDEYPAIRWSIDSCLEFLRKL